MISVARVDSAINYRAHCGRIVGCARGHMRKVLHHHKLHILNIRQCACVCRPWGHADCTEELRRDVTMLRDARSSPIMIVIRDMSSHIHAWSASPRSGKPCARAAALENFVATGRAWCAAGVSSTEPGGAVDFRATGTPNERHTPRFNAECGTSGALPST